MRPWSTFSVTAWKEATCTRAAGHPCGAPSRLQPWVSPSNPLHHFSFPPQVPPGCHHVHAPPGHPRLVLYSTKPTPHKSTPRGILPPRRQRWGPVPTPSRCRQPRRSPLRMAASRSLRASLMGISGICGLRGSTAGAGGDAECAGEAAMAGGPGGGGGGATGGPMGPACGGEAE